MNLIYMVFKHIVVFRHQYISQSKLTTTSYLFCLESSIHIHSSLSWSLKWHTSPVHWQPSFFLEQRTFKFSTLCWSFLSTNEVNQRGHGLSATLTRRCMVRRTDGLTDRFELERILSMSELRYLHVLNTIIRTWPNSHTFYFIHVSLHV